MKPAVLFAVLAVVPSSAPAQENPLQLLQNVAANYRVMSQTTYEFELVEVRESFGDFHTRTEQRQRIVGNHGRYRDQRIPTGPLYLFDGRYNWQYNPERSEYTKTSAGAPARLAPNLAMLELTGYGVKNARLVGQENLELGGRSVVCQVMEVEREPPDNGSQYSPTTYWIDASRNLVLKSRYKYTSPVSNSVGPTEVTVSFTKASVGQPVDESLLDFSPPADAVEVERLSFGPKSSLVGRQSPDFELRGIQGETITSAALRGRAVLLQFAPRADDDSLLPLEMTYRALKGNGLAAFLVLPSARAGVVSEQYTVPVATDGNGVTAKKFGIYYSGAVLISRSGKISYLETSSGTRTALAQALQDAGVW